MWSHEVRRCRIRKRCDLRMVQSCRVIKSGFGGFERSALEVVLLEVEVIVRWVPTTNLVHKHLELDCCKFGVLVSL